MTDERPDPDVLLSELQGSHASKGEGRLKIFLGMSPGVGKTYSMLLAGQTRREEGTDAVIGLLETHGRVETAAVAAGLPRVPRKVFEHRGVKLEEMDIDANTIRELAAVPLASLAIYLMYRLSSNHMNGLSAAVDKLADDTAMIDLRNSKAATIGPTV